MDRLRFRRYDDPLIARIIAQFRFVPRDLDPAPGKGGEPIEYTRLDQMETAKFSMAALGAFVARGYLLADWVLI